MIDRVGLGTDTDQMCGAFSAEPCLVLCRLDHVVERLIQRYRAL